MDHLEPVRQKVRAAPVGNPPLPWSVNTVAAIGGLTEVGFADDSDLLLVFSHQGRGVFDCSTGERVARDPSVENVDSWYGSDILIGLGIGPLAGKHVPLAGLKGGGLRSSTKGGWSTEQLAIDWPDEYLLLLEPHCSIYQTTARFTKLAVRREVRAFGFSYTGNSLIIATSSDVTIFCRCDCRPRQQ
jgi:hypothetical protein